MNTLFKSTRRINALSMLALLAGIGIATPALADRGDDGYRGRGYDTPRYQNYDRGDWGRDHGYRRHGGDRDAYYAAPYYAAPYYSAPRVIYAPPPPPVVYYPSNPYRSGVEVRFLQLF